MNKLILTNAVITSLASRKTLDGNEHIVVPVIAIKEGVLNGIFYSKEEIQAFAQAWNGVPVPVYHPKKDNIYVSANSPEFEDTTNIGKLFNVNYSDGKLKGEIWINTEKAIRLGFEDIIERFDNGEMMEVSTGLFSEKDKQAGIFNNTTYNFVAKNIRADHLALLPNDIGACSIEDGCGAMRANKKDPCCNNCSKKEIEELRSKWSDALKVVGSKIGITSNEASHNDIRNQIICELDKEHEEGKPWPWVADVFNDNFIYELDSKLYRRSYFEKDSVVTLENDAAEVVRKTEYEAVKNLIGNVAVKSDLKGVSMTDKDKVVAALIANEATQYTENDKESLMVLDEAILTKMEPVVNDKQDDNKSNIVANSISDEEMALFNRLKANEESRIADLRKSVVDEYEHLSDEVVANMSIDAVEALAKSIKPAVDFSARSGSGVKATTNKVRQHRPVLLANINQDKEAS